MVLLEIGLIDLNVFLSSCLTPFCPQPLSILGSCSRPEPAWSWEGGRGGGSAAPLRFTDGTRRPNSTKVGSEICPVRKPKKRICGLNNTGNSRINKKVKMVYQFQIKPRGTGRVKECVRMLFIHFSREISSFKTVVDPVVDCALNWKVPAGRV